MSISRVHTWSAGEVLTAADLNAEFSNVLNNGADLVSPFTKAISMGGFALNFDAANTIALTATTSGAIMTGGTIREPTEDALTAHAGGTQAAALALSVAKKYHRISVCATAGDSVALPTSTAGQAHFIRNDGAAAAQVFGTTPDTINSVATATGVALPAGMGAWYVCTTAGNWTSTIVSVQGLTSLSSVAGTNTVTATAAFPPGAYVVGQVFEGIAANTNTAATTLNISSLGAGAVQIAGAALTGGELLQNAPFRVFVSATTPVFQLIANGQAAPFLDTNALVKGSADGTKKMRIEADAITTGTTRVLNMPDADVYLAGLSSATQTANTVYAGPSSGGATAPAFRTLVPADITFSPITNSIAGDVALNNTANYFTGPTIAQGTSGTWFVSGSVTLTDTAGACAIYCKLWDGTTVIASGLAEPTGANLRATVALSGYIASPAGNLRISCRDASSTSGVIIANSTGNSKDSTISAIRIA